MALILFLVRDAPHSLAISQAINPITFDVELEQWLDSLPTSSLAAGGILPPPGEVLRRPSYANNDVRIQRDRYLALSGTVAITLDTVRLSIRAPPFLFLSAPPPMLAIWFPISDWGNVSTWSVIEALQYAARSLLSPYDPAETLAGQIFARTFVNLQVQRLLRMMDAMPIAVWDLQVAPYPSHASSLRWSSNWNPACVGPSGQVYHQRAPWTNQVVFTFEIHHPARFVFQYTLEPHEEHLYPRELRNLVKEMVYIV